uniref:Uncharacterized protein n=1 Tax=Percolomonas cosmopolitus TaxID=63605 RepID=A0A7S1KN45_9EUKA
MSQRIRKPSPTKRRSTPHKRKTLQNSSTTLTSARLSADSPTSPHNPTASPTKNTILVHNGELFQELLQDLDQQNDEFGAAAFPGDDANEYQPHLTRKMNQMNLIAQAKSRHEVQAKGRWEQIERATQRTVQKAKSQQEDKFRKQYADLMDERENFLSKVDKHLHFSDEEYMFGLAKLHEKWTKDVFEPIQNTVMEQVEKNGDAARKHRNECYDKFLKADARGSGVFRDIIDVDYDPHEVHAATVKYRTSRTMDPVKFSETKRIKEDTVRHTMDLNPEKKFKQIIASPLNKVNANSRGMMEPQMWSIPEATPSGRYSHQNPKNYAKPHDRTKSEIPLEHYVEPDRETVAKLVQKEIGPGKRIYKDRIQNKSLEEFTHGQQSEKILNAGKRVAGYRGQESTLKIG